MYQKLYIFSKSKIHCAELDVESEF